MSTDSTADYAENEAQGHASCPHCGSLKDPWFSRILPMGYYCQDCGEDVDETPGNLYNVNMEIANV